MPVNANSGELPREHEQVALDFNGLIVGCAGGDHRG
jgi:hypothetical protein